MNREGHENIDLFIGQEVEHTPAHGQKTLFVVGLQDATKILDVLANHRAYLDPARHLTHVRHCQLTIIVGKIGKT